MARLTDTLKQQTAQTVTAATEATERMDNLLTENDAALATAQLRARIMDVRTNETQAIIDAALAL